ncbi:XkdX family protein [Clostridioides difficile]|nr:XkdX family protein [Clostridioides difficile]MCJ0310342.1 XkdX family protein [Clostridioides difficile]MCJ0377616.1 XkdX family protein [Clostridioides difficile]MCJ0410817.1 XkdX family protein [Clostridioides difficile]MCO8703365.1 XkdX family protein [Clostridioides difficile]MDF3817548.1 XkdX family protein [Clostridioides difficile]
MLGFDKIRYYYENKMWSKEMVKNAVLKEKITAKEYEEIIGEDYIA